MKRYVIGDIHGAYKALIQCLQLSNFDYENDQLITLGDIVDGWSETLSCVKELKKIKNVIHIIGNHDIWFLEFLKTGIARSIWLNQGGEATFNDYQTNCEKILSHDELIRFFNYQHNFYIDEQNNLFVHGGLPAGTSIINRRFNGYKDDLLWDRDMLRCAILRATSKGYKNMKSWFSEYNNIFVGHTAIAPDKFKQYTNVWPMDTGAGWYGRLTIMNIDTKEYWQSDFVRDLYPNIKGRQ